MADKLLERNEAARRKAGELQALLRRGFSRAAYSWDCC